MHVVFWGLVFERGGGLRTCNNENMSTVKFIINRDFGKKIMWKYMHVVYMYMFD